MGVQRVPGQAQVGPVVQVPVALLEYNTGADELIHPDFEGFSLDCRLPAPETLFVFPLPQDCCLRLDFLRFPPKIP